MGRAAALRPAHRKAYHWPSAPGQAPPCGAVPALTLLNPMRDSGLLPKRTVDCQIWTLLEEDQGRPRVLCSSRAGPPAHQRVSWRADQSSRLEPKAPGVRVSAPLRPGGNPAGQAADCTL